MLTAEEIAILALARVEEFTDTYPKARSLMYRRISRRQEELFAMAADVNPDYYGTCASAPLVDGACDLRDIADPVPTPEQLTVLVINEQTIASPYAVGDEIRLVPFADRFSAELPPRMTLRDGILKGVGTDLDEVTSITVYYSRKPTPIAATDGAVATEIPGPYDELLVVDLTAHLLRGARAVEPQARDTALQLLATEENGLLDGWLEQVARYAAPTARRFQRPPAAPREGQR